MYLDFVLWRVFFVSSSVFKNNFLSLQGWKHYLRHIKSGFKNSQSFLKFYLDDNIPAHLLKASIEFEETFQQFNSHYGPNQVFQFELQNVFTIRYLNFWITVSNCYLILMTLKFIINVFLFERSKIVSLQPALVNF